MSQTTSSTLYKATPLWGGDAVCDLPKDFIDVSKVRQVPDNQECYIDKDGYTSIIFDLLSRIGPKGSGPEIDGPALTAHLEEIVGKEESEKINVWNTTETKFSRLSKEIPAYTLIATSPSSSEPAGQPYPDPSHANEQQGTLVFTALIVTLIRLEKVNTDIVITINVPHIRGEYDDAEVDLEQGRQGNLIGHAIEHAQRIWETLKIKNLGLFGSEYDGVKEYDEL